MRETLARRVASHLARHTANDRQPSHRHAIAGARDRVALRQWDVLHRAPDWRVRAFAGTVGLYQAELLAPVQRRGRGLRQNLQRDTSI